MSRETTLALLRDIKEILVLQNGILVNTGGLGTRDLGRVVHSSTEAQTAIIPSYEPSFDREKFEDVSSDIQEQNAKVTERVSPYDQAGTACVSSREKSAVVSVPRSLRSLPFLMPKS